MGKAYWALGDTGKAISSFKKALEQDSGILEVHFSLGACLGETGQIEAAIEHFQAYLRQSPGDVSALNNLALLYEKTGQINQARVTWLRVKEKTRDKTYCQRAEQHLYRMAYESENTAVPRSRQQGDRQTGQTEGKGG